VVIRAILALLLALTLSSAAAQAWLMQKKHQGTSITSVQLSGSSVQFAASGPYYVGTLTTNLSPQTPTFNNLSGAFYQLVGSAGSCSGGDTTHFQIMNGGDVYTNALLAGTYKLCITAGAARIASYTATFAGITEGHKIDASSATYCTGNGSGTRASPWQSVCIQNAVKAAVAGDTVFLPAGNWALNTANTGVTISKTINLVGAGSGNRFSAVGNPLAPGYTDPCPTSLSTLTCVATEGTTTILATTGGWIHFSSCNNVSVSHLFVDGSRVATGGGNYSTLNFANCRGVTVNDIRVLGFDNSAVSGETQFAINATNNALVENSSLAAPIDLSGGGVWYSPGGGLQSGVGNYHTVKNNYFYGSGFNPIALDNVIFTGNVVFQGDYPNGSKPDFDPSFGLAGCAIGPGANCIVNDRHNGSYYFAAINNYFLANGHSFGAGAGVNDPGTAGGVNGLIFTGNTLVAASAAIDSCVWHYYDYTQPNNPYDPSNAHRPYVDCTPDLYVAGGAEGMQVNGNVNSDCRKSSSPSAGFTSTNNSIIAASSAQLDAAGTGIIYCWLTATAHVQHDNTVVNFTAQQNYLSSPHNLYLYSAASLNETLNPNVTGNYCAGGSTFIQTDATSCATTGFTTPPTVSFTLGLLYYDPIQAAYNVPFTTTNFTAQYGAVKWLTSTSPKTPTRGGQSGTGCNGKACGWSYVPPVYLSEVRHGQTVYMWTMDSAHNISAPASALIH
jgi:hypothetical protein